MTPVPTLQSLADTRTQPPIPPAQRQAENPDGRRVRTADRVGVVRRAGSGLRVVVFDDLNDIPLVSLRGAITWFCTASAECAGRHATATEQCPTTADSDRTDAAALIVIAENLDTRHAATVRSDPAGETTVWLYEPASVRDAALLAERLALPARGLVDPTDGGYRHQWAGVVADHPVRVLWCSDIAETEARTTH